mgnify:CR=1 FL=1
MEWFKATRASGDKNGPGEFTVEDSEGVEWQVPVIPSKVRPGMLSCARPVVCLNRGYECGDELEYDVFEAVREVLETESTELTA